MRPLTFFLSTSKKTVILAVVTGLLSGMTSAGLIALINSTLHGSHSGERLALSFAALAVAAIISGAASQLLLMHMVQHTIYDLRTSLSRRIMASPLRHLEEIGPNRLFASLTEDIPALATSLLTVPSLCINIATLCVSLIYLVWLSTTVFLTMVGFILPAVLVYRVLVNRGLRSFKLARDSQSVLMSDYRAMTEGIKELKLHRRRRRAFMKEGLEITASIARRHVLAGQTIHTAAEAWGRLLFYAFLGLLLFGFPGVRDSNNPVLTGSILIILNIMGPVGGIMNAIPVYGRARIALQQIEAVGLSLASAADDEADDRELPRTWRRLDLINLTHSYRREADDTSFTLGPLDLTLRRGEVVFLIGGNGSGKTTFAKLLTGLYAPERGEIKLDGLTIDDSNIEMYRQQFTALFSDFYLFQKLIGLEARDLDERARRYLALLQLDNKVKVENGKLSSLNLSSGQRGRLALLAAYLEDRSFYVLDEWAANQDSTFKDVFYLQLLSDLKARGKAVLVITHDEKYFHLADRIIRLEQGKLYTGGDDSDEVRAACEQGASSEAIKSAV
ncbi:MAG: cyclic peptide export ABC transporter [Blastocatellia bacterium]